MKVLVVDDEASLRAICERTLRDVGHAVETAASGEEAVGLAGRDWDIVLTDMSMPGAVDGLGVLRRFKAAGRADVLMMTAFPEMSAVIAALKLGAYDFILKPFSPDLLEAAVERCAAKRRLSAELVQEKTLAAELARARKIKDAFGLFVAPEVADYVLSRPQEEWGRGTRRTVTVMFADVRKFTPYAESVAPEAAVETLNEFFACVIAAIRAEGGILNKFIGDGILALFGAPLSLEGQERAAARAALRAMESVGGLSLSRAARGLPPLGVGIGLNTGEVIAGCLGNGERTEYSVIGHAVNLAARLEKAAAAGQILMGEATARALGGFARRPAARVSLRGVAEPGGVWELLGEEAFDDADTGR